MRGESYYMLSFQSTHSAMAAQALLRERLRVCVMPTLRQVSASCGISLRMEEGDGAAFLRLAEAGFYRISPSTLYHVGETVESVREF